jgi:hypothetical protein
VVLPTPTALSAGRVPAGLPSPSGNPLLPLPGRSPLSLPTVAPNGQAPGFQYPTPGPQVADPATGPVAHAAASTGLFRWGKSVALALILLVVAAHLGAWTRRLRRAQVAATPARAVSTRAKRGGPLRGNPGRDATSPGTTRKTPPAPMQGTTAGATTAPATAAARTVAEQPLPAGSGTATRPASGRLIDAKASVADAAVLGASGVPMRSAPAPADESAGGSSSSAVMAATARARAATDGKARAQSKAGRSHPRHSAGNRGRRRAD